jgi:hypothetical protein
MEFLARKYALVEPQYIKSKRSLGEYCSFKLPEVGDIIHNTKKNNPQKHPAILGSYRKASIVMGLRFEWREGKTKLHVMHKVRSNGGLGDVKRTSLSLSCINSCTNRERSMPSRAIPHGRFSLSGAW